MGFLLRLLLLFASFPFLLDSNKSAGGPIRAPGSSNRVLSQPRDQQGSTVPPSAKSIHAGPLTLDVYVGNRTAHIFHVVDQLSAWSPYCHAQYRRYWEKTYGPFTPQEKALLAAHARLRQRRGWGALEPIFYTANDLDRALADPRLGADDAATERRVFEAFTLRIEHLMATESGAVVRFATAIEAKRPELETFATKAARLVGTESLHLPVYLIANPDDVNFGGGYNGGRLTLEVPRKTDAFPMFLHEVFHGFLEPHQLALDTAARGIFGLDGQTLNEGLAYALSPGLLHEGEPGTDPLRLQVSEDFKNGKRLSDAYTRFNRFGLALRPLVQQSLDDPHATLETLLPRAVDTWRTVSELSLAFQTPERPRIASFGPAWEALNDRSWALGYWLVAHTHADNEYRQVITSLPKGTTVFLLYAGNFPAKYRNVPTEYRDLLPKTQEDIDATLARGENIEAEGTARGLHIILLAAPTEDALKSLVAKTKFLTQAPPQVGY